MKKILVISLLLLSVTIKAQTIYYVSVNGNDNSDGLSEGASWRTITYAVSSNSPLVAGDTLFVKAGHYLNENIVIEKNGNPSNPIVIQGYQTVPNIIPDFDFDYGDILDSTKMPLIDGQDRTTGIGIDINGKSNIIINYFQITNFENGIFDHSHLSNLNISLNHIILKDFGDTSASYSGKAIEFYSSNNEITNCIVVNASAQGILVYGDYNIIKDCSVYCDDNTSVSAAMDYYIVVYFGNNNIIEDCFVERVGDLPHGGHGIGVKGDCLNNIFYNCTAKNLRGESFYVRHRGSKYNIFNKCKAIGITEGATGLVVRDGASDNEFNNCSIDSCKRGIMFYDTSEDGGAQYCGRNNKFNNCIISNTEIGIDFNDYDQDTDVDSNSFYNCVFFEGTTLFGVERNNFNNKMVNCIISNYQTLEEDLNGYSLNFDFNFCDFYNNGFSMPSGTGNFSDNPLFINQSTGDYHLQNNSPCIDAGTSDNAPMTDFEGISRPQGSGFDIGAYEYSNTTGINENTYQTFSVYPNPTKGILYLDKSVTGIEYQIFSVSGKLVQKGKINANSISSFNIEKGIYLLKIDNSKTIKIIKE